jgi:hypothetical protein
MTIIGIIYWFKINNFSFYFGKLPLKVNFIILATLSFICFIL